MIQVLIRGKTQRKNDTYRNVFQQEILVDEELKEETEKLLRVEASVVIGAEP